MQKIRDNAIDAVLKKDTMLTVSKGKGAKGVLSAGSTSRRSRLLCAAGKAKGSPKKKASSKAKGSPKKKSSAKPKAASKKKGEPKKPKYKAAPKKSSVKAMSDDDDDFM